jgi:hypothetical protein
MLAQAIGFVKHRSVSIPEQPLGFRTGTALGLQNRNSPWASEPEQPLGFRTGTALGLQNRNSPWASEPEQPLGFRTGTALGLQRIFSVSLVTWILFDVILKV